MAKDWDIYKTELKRLYMTEGLTLLEIQKVLKDQGFDASERAYRMRFDEWGFRKYRLKKLKHTNRLEPPLVPSTSHEEEPPACGSEHEISRERSYWWHTALSSAPRTRALEPPGEVCNHGDDIASDNLNDFITIRYQMTTDEGFKVPRMRFSRAKMRTFIPGHLTSLYIYAVIATWNHDYALESLLELETILSNKLNREMILSSRRVRVDFRVITNIFQLMTHHVHSLDLAKITKRILEAIQSDESLHAKIPWWATVWVKARNTCDWEIACKLLLNKQKTPSMEWEAFASTGRIMTAERLLQHHYDYLVNNVRCQLSCCGRREEWQMRAEFLKLMEFFTTVAGPWGNVKAHFYKLGFEIALTERELSFKEAKLRRNELQEAKMREEKYLQVISKYTRIDVDKIGEQLDDFVAGSFKGDKNLAQPRKHLPSESTAEVLRIAEAAAYSTITIPYSNWPHIQTSAECDPFNNKGTNFQILFLRWSNQIGGKEGVNVEFSGICLSSGQVLGLSKDSVAFRHLIDWTAAHVRRHDQMPFLKAMVKAFLFSSSSPTKLFLSRVYPSKHLPVAAKPLPPRFRVTYIPNWVTVKDFVLGDKEYVPRNTNAWTGLEFPEVTIVRLFGEYCLGSLHSHLTSLLTEGKFYDDTPQYIVKYRDHFLTVLNNLSAWNIPIDPVFVDFLRTHFPDMYRSSEVFKRNKMS